ncbi:MAG: hypothetical protein WDZ91_05260 [Paenibacillaceae bacterium]
MVDEIASLCKSRSDPRGSSTLAKDAGYHLDWRKAEPGRVFDITVRSKVDTKDLIQVIHERLQDREIINEKQERSVDRNSGSDR